MNEVTLFRRTRWRLTCWYAGVMGVILGVSSFGVYEAIDHAHRMTADRELQSVAGRLHDYLEPTLQQPNELAEATQRLLPGPCLGTELCLPPPESFASHSPGDMFQSHYYIRLLSPSGELLAHAGLHPPGLPLTSPQVPWQVLQDEVRVRYRQTTLPLHATNRLLWGYLQVGSSLEESDRYLAMVRLVLLIGLPLGMAFVSLASWALAGLAMRPIRRSFQQMQQFTADAAHELRTPIAAAQATVESVLGGTQPSGSDAEEMLQVLDRQHQRLSQLIQDLLLLTRLDCQVQTNPLVPCCLQDLVSDLVEELAALALHKHIHFQAQMEAKLPLHVLGDEAQLYRLVFNLVVNALQYTPEGGQVTISLGQQAQQALIAIQDTGMGIAPKELAKIFDRFYRVDHDRSRQTGGSGLGLSIAQAIAHIHCGEITVQSQPDRGSTFTLHLPIAPHQ